MKEKTGGIHKINKRKGDGQIIKAFKYEKLKEQNQSKPQISIFFLAVQCFCYSPKFKKIDAHTLSTNTQKNLNGINYQYNYFFRCF